MHFFLGNIHSRVLKCLQFIYESFDYDLTHGFFIQDFNKNLLYDDIFDCDLTHGFLLLVISIKIFLCNKNLS